ncbi:MAG: metallophosphoesterase family protein [Planctomycetes bacterium]|nr:metallophosphoesterase family protein [Planctomycetota bacterium]
MKYGILGDIHGNLSALEVALSVFKDERVERIVSVGDVVGYGGAPRECIARLRELDAVVVKGNHDAACTGEIDIRYFNNYARDAVRWTQSVLSVEELAWLHALPLVTHLDHCSVAHGTYHRPGLYDYIQSTTDADPSLDEMILPVCFVGHTHVPVTLLRLKEDPLRTAYTVDPEIDLSESAKALVNVGSVGQPRDEDPRTAFAIYDSREDRVSIRRASYDIEVEARRIRSAGLPSVLAERLFLGV